MDNEKNNIKFAIFPLEILNNEQFNNLTARDSVLYMLLLNRLNLSKRNSGRYSDKNGVFVYYSNEQITKDIRCNKGTASTMLNNLESAGLIRKEYQKRGMPLKIYVNDIFGICSHIYPQPKSQDKPCSQQINNSNSPAVQTDKDVSFDIEKTKQQTNDSTLDFGNMKNKKRRH